MSESPGAGRLVAGRYRLLAELGRGGMGIVWQARDEVLAREVAVKEVRAPNELDGPQVRQLYARLEREGRAAARISHRNVVTVYDVASEGGRPWIVMELVRGLSLADTLDADGALTPARAAHIGAEVLTALKVAHAAGVLHRDVKPGNVLLANDGRVVLTDFGIAMVAGTSSLTMTGELVGSPEFLAPERALGRAPGPESDLWSLGVLLYASVEGHTPFRQDTPLSTLRAVVDAELPPPRRAGPLAPVIEGLLRKDPAQRLKADAAARLLRVVAAGGAPPAPPVNYTPTRVVDAPRGARQEPPYDPRTRTAPRPVPPMAPAGPPRAGSATPAYGPPASTAARRRRRILLVAVGVLVAALAAGGVAWGLLGDGDGDAHDGGTSSQGSGQRGGGYGGGSGGSDSPGGGNGGGGAPGSGGASKSAGGGGGSAKNGNSGGGQTTSKPPASVTVTVTVTAYRDSYTGSCPAAPGEAPSFRGDITVSRTPATVGYRWVTGSGRSSDPGWKSLTFADGGGRQKPVEHTELTYKEGQSSTNWIGVEIKSPKAATSNHVSFTVTCKEAPTDGTSETTTGATTGAGTGAATGTTTGEAVRSDRSGRSERSDRSERSEY
ncbi:serine/threonine-protein kinase [Streptomyces sp. H27-D2]|uniref:serine/threonine-protein kinase n=1 Tax=Streptomyces sp. H27-D2 TaxID=3046304 RepID=UPI002DB8A59D|nr:serine/threonine-protein kinase [Streptomyces sp. H27-D2]MEC4018542.1 serine/threonine-protein kinase [Streptomyces sp. H27-D2]